MNGPLREAETGANSTIAVLAAFYFSSGRLLLLGPVPDVDDGAVPGLLLVLLPSVLSLLGQFPR